jgi:hypothetical protein
MTFLRDLVTLGCTARHAPTLPLPENGHHDPRVHRSFRRVQQAEAALGGDRRAADEAQQAAGEGLWLVIG